MKRPGRPNRIFLALGLLFLLAALALEILARRASGFAEWYARGPYRLIVETVGRFFGIFPFSVVEIVLYLGIALILISIILRWRHPFWIITRAVFLGGILAFLYAADCGVNYYAEAFSDYVGLEPGLHTKDELVSLCGYLVEKVNENVTDESYLDGNQRSWKEESVLAMEKLGEEFPVLGGYYPRPKGLLISRILSVQQLCGIYSPFTIEASFNTEMPDYNIPHTMCHELSHLKGFMREDEANFLGYLACTGSNARAFRYSGYLMGWVYAGNELAKQDPELYREYTSLLCDEARADLASNNAFWDSFEGKVSEVSNEMNDRYLKANGREDGVKSYGRAVDLMLAWYARSGE